MNIIKKIINRFEQNMMLVENIIYLFGLRGAEYLLAIILIPFLVRALGPEKYGAIVLAQSILQYFIVINNYGFYYTATRAIALENDKDKQMDILNTVNYCKLILLIFVIFSFIFLQAMHMLPVEDNTLFYFCFVGVIGQAFFPVWFFQGIQRMRFVTIANVVARLFSLVFIIVLVTSSKAAAVSSSDAAC